jgi:glycine/D-amino acid oxidase-like deaminating enzyme
LEPLIIGDKTSLPTEDGKQELIDRIKEIITCDFEIKHHFAGVRPTVKDRRPLVGTYKDNSSIHLLNGLGLGVMLGPWQSFIRMDRNKTT